MHKRGAKESGSNFYSPAKKKKLNITVKTNNPTNRQSTSKKQEDDLWGDDFLQEEDLLELDAVASQAFSQEVHISQDESFQEIIAVEAKPSPKPSTSWLQVPSFVEKNHNPSPKKTSNFVRTPSKTCTVFPKPLASNAENYRFIKPTKPSFKEPVRGYQAKKPSDVTQIDQNLHGIVDATLSTQSTAFADFESKLLQGNNMNSTFQSQKSVVVFSDDAHLKRLAKLEEENEKLLNDLMTKEGENGFLRSQQAQMQKKLEKETLAKFKAIDELETKHRAELLSIRKEKEETLTQFKLQALDLNKYKGKCKILEKGIVKLVEPHSVYNDPGHRNRINTTINRGGLQSKKITFKENATQAKVFDKSIYKLKSSISINPLKGIPEFIFETSEPEKSIVDIHIVEKIGKRNLPILQDGETCRIFENPELVKPIVSIVDNRQLSVQFFLPSLTGLLNKTMEEINSREIVPTINRLVTTTRELTLNTLTSLKKIFNAMKNDDVRDMNDFHHSSYYKIPVSHRESIFDAKRWYEKERGIETRRSLAVFSYVVMTSTYLGEYITGKIRLKVDEDLAYKSYIQQLRTYKSWAKKDCDFEFLEIILEFVKLMGLTRRAHQFSGIINAIALTLNNSQKAVGFCSTGLDYVFKIFREIVFSRPLTVCFRSISEMMMTFGGCARFSEKLCVDASSTALSLINGTWYFKPGPNTCALEIYFIQMQNFVRDPITIINITYAIVSFMQTTLPMNVMSWKEEQSNSCKCCVQLIRFTVKTLSECSRINIDGLEATFRKPSTYTDDSKILDRDFWKKLKSKQHDIMIKGIRFLSYLLIREADYVLRRTDMENAFYLFIHHVKNFKDLKLHENEREIIERLEIVDRVNSENSSRSSEHLIKCTAKTQVPVAPENDFRLKAIYKLRGQCFSRL